MKTRDYTSILRIPPAVWGMLPVLMLICVGPASPGDPGVLRLKVCDCSGSELSGAYVEVTLERDGYGEVDSSDGYTDGNGRIDFPFGSLEDGDLAHVTVTPAGGDPDASHAYVWEDTGESSSEWDTTLANGPCGDDWFSSSQNIIRLKTDG